MKHKRRLAVYLFVLILSACFGGSFIALGDTPYTFPADIATYPLSPADQTFVANMVAVSDLIVRGRVERVEGYWATDGLIKSRNTIAVRYAISGEAESQIEVRTLGGWIDAEQIGMDVSHYAQLNQGEEVILFLQETRKGYRISNGILGKLTIVKGLAKREELNVQTPLTALMTSLQQALQEQDQPSAVPRDWQQIEAQLASASGRALRQFNPNGTKWPSNRTRYKVNINTAQVGGDNGSKQDFINAIQNAAERWNQIETANFSFVYAGEHSSVVLGRNNTNEIFWANPADHTDDPINYNPAFLAYTKRTFTQKGTLLEVDMWINDQRTWDGIGEVFGTEFDLDTVMMHEFGHALGLGHDIDPSKPTQVERETNGESSAVMYWIVPSGITKRDLHANDIAGISSIYPCTAVPCNSPPVYVASLTVDESSAGLLIYNDPSGMVASLQIPTGAVTEPITIGVRSIQAQNLLSDTLSAALTLQFDAIRGDEVIADYPFAISSTLSISYTNANVAGIDESTLRILNYDSVNKAWQQPACGGNQGDLETNTIVISICYVGQFALIGQAASPATPTPVANIPSKVYLPTVLR